MREREMLLLKEQDLLNFLFDICDIAAAYFIPLGVYEISNLAQVGSIYRKESF